MNKRDNESVSSRIVVSIIIPVRNEELHIRQCLRSVVTSGYFDDAIEVLVIDGRSDDATQAIVREFCLDNDRIHLIDNPDRTVPRAMNIGILESKGKYLVRLDAHAFYPKDYVVKLIFWLEKLGADNVGGRLTTLAASDNREAIAVALILSHPLGVGNSRFRVGNMTEPEEVDTVPFGCFRREIFDRVGIYDEMMIRNQDEELNSRIKRAGGKIFLIPEVRVEYMARDTLQKLAIMLYQYGFFKPLTALKMGRFTTIRQLAPPAFTLAMLGLPVLSIAQPSLLWLWGAILGAHSCLNLAVSTSLASKHGWSTFPPLFAGFLLAHLAYGIGFVRGLFAFAIFRQHLKRPLRDVRLSR